VRVGHIFAPTITVNFSFAPNSVFSWVTDLSTKDTSVFTYLPIDYTYLVTLCSMRLFFLSLKLRRFPHHHPHPQHLSGLTNLLMSHILRLLLQTMVQGVAFGLNYLMKLILHLLPLLSRTSIMVWMGLTCMACLTTMHSGLRMTPPLRLALPALLRLGWPHHLLATRLALPRLCLPPRRTVRYRASQHLFLYRPVLQLGLSMEYDRLRNGLMEPLLGVLRLHHLILLYYILNLRIIVLPFHPHIGAWLWR
jgi:hypothetical protein